MNYTDENLLSTNFLTINVMEISVKRRCKALNTAQYGLLLISKQW